MGDYINALQYKYKGGFGIEEDAPSIAANGRYEGFVSFGDTKDPAEAVRLARSVLRYSTLQTPTYGVVLEPRGPVDEYGTGWNVGDTVSISDGSGALVPQRIVSATLTETDAGDPVAVPELGSLVTVAEEREARLRQRMLAGGLGGMTSNAGSLELFDPEWPHGELRQGESPTFNVPGEVEVSTSAPWLIEKPTRLVGWALVSETFGLSTTRVEYRINDVMLTPLDYLELLSVQNLSLARLFGQGLVLGPGDRVSIRVTIPGAHENVAAKFVGVDSI